MQLILCVWHGGCARPGMVHSSQCVHACLQVLVLLSIPQPPALVTGGLDSCVRVYWSDTLYGTPPPLLQTPSRLCSYLLSCTASLLPWRQVQCVCVEAPSQRRIGAAPCADPQAASVCIARCHLHLGLQPRVSTRALCSPSRWCWPPSVCPDAHQLAARRLPKHSRPLHAAGRHWQQQRRQQRRQQRKQQHGRQ